MIRINEGEQRAIGHAKIGILPTLESYTAFDIALFDALETTRLEVVSAKTRASGSFLPCPPRPQSRFEHSVITLGVTKNSPKPESISRSMLKSSASVILHEFLLPETSLIAGTQQEARAVDWRRVSLSYRLLVRNNVAAFVGYRHRFVRSGSLERHTIPNRRQRSDAIDPSAIELPNEADSDLPTVMRIVEMRRFDCEPRLGKKLRKALWVHNSLYICSIGSCPFRSLFHIHRQLLSIQ